MSKIEETGSVGLENTEAARSGLTLQFDATEYLQYVQDHDLSEAQQVELLAAIWVIVVNFVDLGFGIHPVQQVGDVRNFDSVLELDSTDVIVCPRTCKYTSNPDTAHSKNGFAVKEEV